MGNEFQCVKMEFKRVNSELKRANDNGIKVIILCEHGGNVRELTDIRNWINPRLKTSPKAVSGQQLYKTLLTISLKYDVDFVFCRKSETAAKIIELLEAVQNE